MINVEGFRKSNQIDWKLGEIVVDVDPKKKGYCEDLDFWPKMPIRAQILFFQNSKFKSFRSKKIVLDLKIFTKGQKLFYLNNC